MNDPCEMLMGYVKDRTLADPLPPRRKTRPPRPVLVRARKHALLQPGDTLGPFVVVRQLPRDYTANERVYVRCANGHGRAVYAHNLRKCRACPGCRRVERWGA